MAEADEKTLETQRRWATRVIGGSLIIGFFISILYSLQSAGLAQGLSVEGTALAVGGAALLAGGLLGFLFGIPKKLQQDTQSQSGNGGQGVAYQGNTNLEQISDWLTKILVGVGLTQLASIPATLSKYADFTAPGLGNFVGAKVFAIALLLYFLIGGFLFIYLWTRWYLAGTFSQADQAAIEHRISEVEKQIEAGREVMRENRDALRALAK